MSGGGGAMLMIITFISTHAGTKIILKRDERFVAIVTAVAILTSSITLFIKA